MLLLTQKVSKLFMRVHDRPLIEWTIRSSPSEVNELPVVATYLGDQIKDFL